jgi:hypothetical protein
MIRLAAVLSACALTVAYADTPTAPTKPVPKAPIAKPPAPKQTTLPAGIKPVSVMRPAITKQPAPVVKPLPELPKREVITLSAQDRLALVTASVKTANVQLSSTAATSGDTTKRITPATLAVEGFHSTLNLISITRFPDGQASVMWDNAVRGSGNMQPSLTFWITPVPNMVYLLDCTLPGWDGNEGLHNKVTVRDSGAIATSQIDRQTDHLFVPILHRAGTDNISVTIEPQGTYYEWWTGCELASYPLK